jgi:DNA-binding Lrp family transcriptional regulator
MMGDWTFFSNYGHVLVCLSRNREVRLRDVATEVGITERAVQKIVRDLQDAGYLTITKQGRCNRYRINRRKTLRHDLESHCTVGKLLALTAKRRRPVIDSQPASTDQPPAPSVKEIQKSEEEKKEKETNPNPLDTRQQGNLF